MSETGRSVIAASSGSSPKTTFLLVPLLYLIAGSLVLFSVQESAGIATALTLALLMALSVRSMAGRTLADAECFTGAALIFGGAVPLANMFGSGCLLFVACIFLALVARKIAIPVSWAGLWLSLLGASLIVELGYSLDVRALQVLFNQPEQLFSQLRSVHQSPPPWLQLAVQCTRYLALLSIFSIASELPRLREQIIRGIAWTVPASLVIVFLQLVAGQHSFVTAQNPFWSALHRYAGSFSDPNAFGLAALLIAAALAGYSPPEGRRLPRLAVLIFAALLVLSAVAVSGSRSLLLGVILLVACILPLKRTQWAALLVSLMVVLALYLMLPFARIESVLKMFPASIERVARSIHPDTGADALLSRTVFLRLAIAAWHEHPVFGVGLGRFREGVPFFAAESAIKLDGWLDNANNFYLGVLAELGLVGLLILLWTALQLRQHRLPDHSENRIPRYMVWIFLAVLLTGPHIDFDEIAILFAILAAQAGFYVSLQSRQGRRLIPTGVILVMTLAIVRSSAPYGLYAPEREGSEYFSWTRRQSRFLLECDDRGRQTLRYQSLDPRNAQTPLLITLRADKQRQEVTISDNAIHEFEFECPRTGSWQSPVPALIQIGLSRTFQPVPASPNPDFRQLGLRLLGTDSILH